MSKDLTLKRTNKTERSQFGEVYIDGKFQCYSLENGDTLIPCGDYTINRRNSGVWHEKEKEKIEYDYYQGMLELDVKGRTYILIHPANKPSELEGCIATGTSIHGDNVQQSRKPYYNLYSAIIDNNINKIKIKEKTMFGLSKLVSANVIEKIGEAIDNVTTSDEERLEAKKQIKALLVEADKAAQKEVSARWHADMKHGTALSRNIRPITMLFLTMMFVIISFFDGNIGSFSVKEAYTPVYQTLLMTVYGAYFAGRSIEKVKGASK